MWREKGNDQRRGRKTCVPCRAVGWRRANTAALLGLGNLITRQEEPRVTALPVEGTSGMQPLPPPVPGPLALLDTTG